MTGILAWDDPHQLAKYAKAPREKGIYVIGRPLDASEPVTPNPVYDPYVGTWPYSENTVNTTNYTVAMLWSLARDVSFRTSYSTGFLPPSISQVNDSVLSALSGHDIFTLDPARGNEPVGTVAPWQILFGGNPNLQHETSKSFSLGAIFTPTFVPGLR